jgi:hypothetical protein
LDEPASSAARPSGIRGLGSWQRDAPAALDTFVAEAALEPPANADIRAANAELEQLVGSLLKLPLCALAEQRDRAFHALHAERAAREWLIAEQDRFLSFLVADHDDELKELRFEFRQRLEATHDEVRGLKWQLDDARRSVDDARDQAARDLFLTREKLDDARQLLEERAREIAKLRELVRELEEERARLSSRSSQPPPSEPAPRRVEVR